MLPRHRRPGQPAAGGGHHHRPAGHHLPRAQRDAGDGRRRRRGAVRRRPPAADRRQEPDGGCLRQHPRRQGHRGKDRPRPHPAVRQPGRRLRASGRPGHQAPAAGQPRSLQSRRRAQLYPRLHPDRRPHRDGRGGLPPRRRGQGRRRPPDAGPRDPGPHPAAGAGTRAARRGRAGAARRSPARGGGPLHAGAPRRPLAAGRPAPGLRQAGQPDHRDPPRPLVRRPGPDRLPAGRRRAGPAAGQSRPAAGSVRRRPPLRRSHAGRRLGQRHHLGRQAGRLPAGRLGGQVQHRRSGRNLPDQTRLHLRGMAGRPLAGRPFRPAEGRDHRPRAGRSSSPSRRCWPT